jgi:hypothetical protein
MKFGALRSHWGELTEYKRIDIDTSDFGEQLWVAYSKCWPHRTKPKQVFMGPEEFEKLIHQSYKNQVPFTFDIKMGYNGTLFNLPITVVPHMNGVLIV